MRVVVVVENPIIREGVRGILAGSVLQVVGVCASAAEAVSQVQRLAPEVAFLGAGIAAADDYSLLESLRRVSPDTAIILLGMHREAGNLLDALHRGASCYLSQDVTLQSLLLAAEAAVRGFVMADAAALSKACKGLAGQPTARDKGLAADLTAREREVLELVCQGLSNRQIAERLTVTAGTVRTHVSRILGKLGVTDRVQAAVWAAEHGLGGGVSGQNTERTSP